MQRYQTPSNNNKLPSSHMEEQHKCLWANQKSLLLWGSHHSSLPAPLVILISWTRGKGFTTHTRKPRTEGAEHNVHDGGVYVCPGAV